MHTTQISLIRLEVPALEDVALEVLVAVLVLVDVPVALAVCELLDVPVLDADVVAALEEVVVAEEVPEEVLVLLPVLVLELVSEALLVADDVAAKPVVNTKWVKRGGDRHARRHTHTQ